VAYSESSQHLLCQEALQAAEGVEFTA
jgi:hypothetical protein